ncbi:bifunctional isocitrate dehydrogenase kinase/phosphatase [Belliella marina]|uniref:Bifunctional isocitrate dehydrogenase kinase/phosphatase n=1 Tax=Belliella marina TaxID=1644146 RepID=A0ABW4VVM6_9BACT
MKSSYKFINFLLLLSLYAFIACSPDGKNDEIANDKGVLDGLDEEEQLLEIGFQKLSDWIRHWKSIDPKFNVKDFGYSRRDTVEGIERPEELHISQGNPLYPYLKKQPEGEGVVDIYSYKVVYPTEGKAYFNPDSEVTYFRSDGMRERLLFMGPSGAFEDMVWLSAEALLVVGHFEDEIGISPKAWIIYPKEGLISQFDNPLKSQSYKRESFLVKRFTGVSLENGL